MHALKSLLQSVFGPGRRRRRSPGSQCSTQALEPRCLLTTPFSLTDNEQLLLELINRARSNPGAEAALHGVGLNSGISSDLISDTPKQPLAPVQMLNVAAVNHAVDMLAKDYFSHQSQGSGKSASDRAADQGYVGSVGENLSWGGSTSSIDEIKHVYERHLALYKSTGHRRNMFRDYWRESGIGLRYGQFTSDGTAFNASMVVEMFGDRNNSPYITGVVYADLTDNDFYDIGEAVRTGTVSATNLATGQKLSTTLSPSGGYALQVPAGEWSVEAIYQYGGLNVRAVRFAQVSTSNVKLDFERFTTGTPDQLSLSLSRATIGERGADSTAVLTIRQAVIQSVPITVHLSTTATDAIQLPETVVIPAGELSVTVVVQGMEDDRIEQPQQAEITALVYGFGSVKTSLSVVDRTFPRLPSAVQTVQTARPVISWLAVSNASSYEVWGDNTSTGEKRAASAVNVPGTSWTPPSDLALGNWTFYVRASTSDGRRSFWSPAAVWQVRPVPSIVGSGRTELRSAATVRWNAMVGATDWEVWVDGVNPRVSQVVRRSGLTGTSFQLPELPIGSYTYWFRAKNARNEFTPWSPAGRITLTDRVGGIVPVNTLFNSDLTLQWNSLPGADSYDVWIDDRTRNVPSVYRNTTVRGNSVTVAGLLPSALRIWIRARDLSGVLHLWSNGVDILTQMPSVITSPASLSQGSQLTLRWITVAGAGKYQLRLADSQNSTLFTNKDVSATQFTIPLAVAAGRYRVWLAAFDSAGSVLTSTPFDLQIAQNSASSSRDSQLNSPIPALLLQTAALEIEDEISLSRQWSSKPPKADAEAPYEPATSATEKMETLRRAPAHFAGLIERTNPDATQVRLTTDLSDQALDHLFLAWKQQSESEVITQ
jgi:hypothetical protein